MSISDLDSILATLTAAFEPYKGNLCNFLKAVLMKIVHIMLSNNYVFNIMGVI